MGWSIKTNNKDKWEVLSSVVDDVIASFDNEHDLKVWIAKEDIYRGKLKAIETMMTFPNLWRVNDERVIIHGVLSKYHDWIEKLYHNNDEERFKMIDDKLEELMSK